MPIAEGGLPRHHVARPRLVGELTRAEAARVVAGGGYGKTLLALELARALGVASAHVVLGSGDRDAATFVARLASALRRTRLADLAAAVQAERADPAAAVDAFAAALQREPEPMLIVVDDAHHAGDEAGELVARLSGQLPEGHRLLVLARHIPRFDLPGHRQTVSLAAHQLAFTTEEVAELLSVGFGLELPARDVEALRRATEGWAAALVLAAETLGRSDDPEAELQAIVERRRSLRYLVERQLETLDEASREAIMRLAHLPLLSPEVAGEVTGDPLVLERAGAAGLPLRLRDDGWWELPGPVQELLRQTAPLDAAAASAAAPVYSRQGELSSALQVLLAAEEADAAAALVAAISPQEADQLGYLELQTLIDALPATAVERHPRLLMHLARACEPAAQTRLRSGTLEHVGAIAERTRDRSLARAVDAERARDLVRDDRADEAEALAAEVLAQVKADEIATRVRALDVLGRAAAWRRDEASLAVAERRLQEAHALCLRIGQSSWASQVVLPLAHGVYYARGNHEQALELIGHALERLAARSRHRGVLLSFYGDILIDCGRFDEAEAAIDEDRRLGELLGDRRIAAYAAWTAARLASQTGDRERTVETVYAVESHRDDWFEHSTGVDFLADAADLLDRVGETEAALGYLERAKARRGEAPVAVATAEAAVLARSGDPAEADQALDHLSAIPRLEPRERWRVTLLRAYAALRCADAAAGTLAAEAFEQAAALGKPFLPLVRDREIGERLVSLAAAYGSAAAAGLQEIRRPLTIAVLGRFEVRRAGELVRLPRGKPEQLVKVLAICGGRMPAEQAIEELWPEVDPQSGRKRLRNVLNRLHDVAPDIATREGDSLVLGDAEVDADLFEHHARQVLDRQTGIAIAWPSRDIAGSSFPTTATRPGPRRPVNAWSGCSSRCSTLPPLPPRRWDSSTKRYATSSAHSPSIRTTRSATCAARGCCFSRDAAPPPSRSSIAAPAHSSSSVSRSRPRTRSSSQQLEAEQGIALKRCLVQRRKVCG